ncbi:hypothetical protein C0993_001379 [Termitomyces sp. T159_Od127]|nr:hypothetical protein C0993_001379 [Termitomyces sp. T159_Od127]
MDAQAQEQRDTRLPQDVSANENAIAHHDFIAQSPKSGRTQNLTEPQVGESGPVPRTPASTIPFPTIDIVPATPQGSIQEPGIGSQGQQDQSERYSQGPSSIRDAVQDPGPSNQHSRGSQYRQSRQEPALEPTPNAQEPHQSLYSGDYESQILRDFVDAQEQLSPESRLRNPYERRTSESTRGEAHPRSSRTSEKSRAVIGDVVDPGPSRRRSRHRSRSYYNEFTASGATTTEEVIHQLIEKKRESRTLRRALRLAAERMKAENERIVALERDNGQTLKHFLTLHESKMAAEEEALKAASDLRVYQFQLEDARKEIERAREMVRTLENQRHEAEETASRSRAEVRKHAQAHMIAAAKEEGRRLGFEAGLRRAEEEAVYLDSRSRRVPDPRVNEVTALPPDFDLEHVMSSPVRRRTLRAQAPSTHRETPSQPIVQVQPPTPPQPSVNKEEQLPRASAPASDITRATSPGPSLLRYSVYIPPASELEQQNTQTQQLGESSQPWVTAREYHQITGTQPSPESINQASFPDPSSVPNPSSNVVTFASAPLPSSHKKKESWLRRTLTRPWRKASRVVPDAEETSSWYQPPSENPPPGVRVRGDFAPRTHETHADQASMSTHYSQFELVNPPLRDAPGPLYPNPDERAPSLAGSAPKGKSRVRERATPLHVINENLSNTNETSAPLGRDIPTFSSSMGQIRELLGDAGSSYSDPRAVEEWRRSSTSPSIATAVEMSQSRPVRPPSVTSRQSGPPRRRPAHLTVPPLLAPQATNPPSSTVSGGNSQNPALLGVGDMRPSLQRNPTSGTVYGITVEPPSCSPTEAPHSPPFNGTVYSE